MSETSLATEADMDVFNIIEQYFKGGFTNFEVLEELHDVKLSLWTTERRMQTKWFCHEKK